MILWYINKIFKKANNILEEAYVDQPLFKAVNSKD